MARAIVVESTERKCGRVLFQASSIPGCVDCGGQPSMGLKVIGAVVVGALIIIGVQAIYRWAKEKNVDR